MRSRNALHTMALATLVALGLAGCGDGSVASPTAKPGGASPSGPPPPPTVPVKLAEVIERPVVPRVTFVASVQASVATTVGAEVAGQVVEVPVREGERVGGDKAVLARLDTGPREIELREAIAVVAKAREELDKLRRGSRREELAQRDAEVAAQKAILDRAEADHRRAERLAEDGLISRAEAQRFQAEYLAAKHRHRQLLEALRMAEAGPRAEDIAQAEAELQRARARADRIRDEIRRSVIRAPLAGFLVKKHVDVGAWVQAGGRVADLVVLDPAFVTGPVGEREIRLVRPGQPASLTLDAYPGREFQGSVTAIIPEADPASRTFPVRVTVSNSDGLLKAGMFARVAIQAGPPRRGLFVPRGAVVQRDDHEAVFVVNDERAHPVRVETGAEEDGLVEVRSPDLAAGRPVVTLGAELLQPGTKVEAVP